MAIERVHESATVLPSAAEIQRRAADGWRLKALVWEREIGASGKPDIVGEIPYGLQISGDCQHLVENPAEQQVLLLAMDLIVQDQKLSQVADALNARGFRTRDGAKWTPPALFKLLPRLVDAGPAIFISDEWIARHAVT